jgi:diguanylate cyclase (GGDEF)-like protein
MSAAFHGEAADGGRELGPDAGTDGVAPGSRPEELLSPRELEVLASVAEGATNGEVAQKLFIAQTTVQSHVKHILAKLGARTRTEAAVWYVRSYERPRSAEEDALRQARRNDDARADQLARAYADALRAGDPGAATTVVDEGLSVGLSAVAIQSRVIAPAMRAIGELWERDNLTVAEEHLATAVSHHVLTRLYPGLLRRAPKVGDTVVVAAVHGEHHVLGLRMVADVLEGCGFDVRFLGADVPEDSLMDWVEEHHPAAVALGVTMPLGAAQLTRQLHALREHHPDVIRIIGGQGVPGGLMRGAGVLYAADAERLAERLKDPLNVSVGGELPPDVARGGIGFSQFDDLASDQGEGLVARVAQTTAAAADAARGQARREFALEELAFRDPLTQLSNRRAFEERYQELTAADRLVRPAILMIDVDRFKSINDGYGHQAGDEALADVARQISDALRPGDFSARYGGDEFVVLLPGTSPEAAAEVGERIRRGVAGRLTDPQITVSIGVCVPDHADRRRAMLDVDRALYQAKERGRNQVAFA